MRIGHRILSGTMAFILACSMALSATCPVMASGNEPVLTNTESGEKSLEDLIREASESEQDEAINEGTGHTDDDYDWMTESDDDAQGTEGGYPETAPTLYAFDAETVIDGLKVHVTAPEGVFPEGSSLYVGYAQYDTGETQNLAMEYALDISILDADGQAIEPDTTYGQVSVTFESELIANDNLKTDVSHVVNGYEKTMQLTVEEDTAKTETDSFSIYIVRFTYGTLEYILNGGESIAISDILSAVGLTGTLEGAVSSAPDLFSVDTANWTVKALKAFTTRETLTVTLDGIEYVINVTDDGADAGQYAVLYEDGTLVFQNDNATDEALGTAVHIIDLSEDVMAWADVCGADVKTVKFRETFTPNTPLIFADKTPNLEKAELANLDMSVAKDMTNMFNGTPIKEVDFTGFDPTPVTKTEYMFAGCGSLETVTGLNNMRFTHLEYASYMFASCANLKNLDISNCYAPYLREAISMVAGCSSLETLDMSNVYWPYVRLGSMGISSSKKYKTVSFRESTFFTRDPYSYSYYGESADIKNMFSGCQDLTMVDFYKCDLGYTTNMDNTFSNCPLLDCVIMQGMKAPNLKTMTGTFLYCPSLKAANFQGAVFEELRSMNGTFSGCSGLEAATFEGASFPKLTTLDGCFNACSSLKSLTFKGVSMPSLMSLTPSVFGGNGTNSGKSSLENIVFKDAKFDSLTSMNYFLQGATKLKYLDMSGLSLPSLTGMDNLCQGCYNLDRATFANMKAPLLTSMTQILANTGVKYVSFANADMRGLTYLTVPFNGCGSLETLDFTGTNLASLRMLSGNLLSGSDKSDIKTVYFDNADLSSVTDMSNLFYGCSMLETVSFESARTGNITTIRNMFDGCYSLAVFDLTDLDLTNLTNMAYAFNYCQSLKTIDCSTVGDQLRYMDSAFMSCRDLNSIILPGNIDDTSMANAFTNDNNIQRIFSPSGAPRFNTSQASSLPVKDWKHEETQENIADFWNDTETDLTGWFIRGDATELNTDNISEIKYDPNTKTIHMYITSGKELVPCHVNLPSLASILDLNPNLVNKDPALKELLESSFNTEELKLTLRTRTYSDIMACAEAPQVIWTFDVPKTNTSVIRFYIYANDTDTLVGYIENSADAPDVFTQYDSAGSAVSTLEPNTRMSYADMGYAFPEDTPESTTQVKIYGKTFTREQLNAKVYPEYEQYITYDSDMNNYEALIAPGKYRIEMSYPEYEEILLTPAGTQMSEPDDDGNTHVTMYTYQTDIEEGDSQAVRASLFNIIKRDPYSSYSTYADIYNTFLKVDALSGSTIGATFAIQSLMTGTTAEAFTGYLNANIINWYIGHHPYLYEMFKIWEIQAPDGYYLSSDTITMPFYADHIEQSGQIQGTCTYIDGVSITKDIINESACASCCCYIRGYYYTKNYQCLCGDFGSCHCNNCGVSIDGTNIPSGTTYKIKDMPFPTLSIQKKDSGGNRVPGAVLQLIDKETEEVVGEWTTPEDSDYVYRFNMGENAVIPYGGTKTFTLHEKTAPEGYELAADKDVTVSYNSGKISVVMTDPYSKHDIQISKADVHGAEVEGAQLTITGTELNSTSQITPITWTSGTEPHTVQLRPGTYTLHEAAAPEGYIYQTAEDIEFTVGFDGTVTVNEETVDKITMVDKYCEQYIYFKKTDTSGNFLPGATLKVTGRADGETTDIEPQVFEAEEFVLSEDYKYYSYLALLPGTYTVEEIDAPEGYGKADNITFVVDQYGDVYINNVKADDATVVVIDKKLASIQLTKYDSTKTEKLGGAEFDVYKGTAGTEGAVFKHFAVNANGISDIIEGFEEGTYYILETKAPEGHALNDTPLEFTITEDMYNTTVQLEMTDEELLILPEAGGSGTSSLYIPAFAVTLLFMVLAFMAKRKLQAMS